MHPFFNVKDHMKHCEIRRTNLTNGPTKQYYFTPSFYPHCATETPGHVCLLKVFFGKRTRFISVAVKRGNFFFQKQRFQPLKKFPSNLIEIPAVEKEHDRTCCG